jgi:hypothetical protein
MKIGDSYESFLKIKVCKECGYEINNFGCSYGCKYDTDIEGPVIIRTYRRIDTLVKEEIYDN